ncbi:MAG: dTDP-4-dehydrorhamnose 3,5-epimerase [Anaerolineaceae bacterium]
MEFISTSIPDVILIIPKVYGDQRGFFLETFRQDTFDAACGHTRFVQDNHSGSKQGTLRGLHYQLQQAQGKLVRAVAGEIFDVAVDLRPDSATFGKWVGSVLSAENKHQLWIPAGFAHGFYVVSEWAEVFYKATDYYAPHWERSLRWDDPDLGIQWPLVDGAWPVLSPKDAQAPHLEQAEIYPAGWSAN